MSRFLKLTLICSLLLLCQAGISMAEESHAVVAYVQGGESSIAEGADGMVVITVQDVVPYIHIADNEKSSLEPVQVLTTMTEPLDAALVFSGADNESTSIVEVSNLSLSEGNRVLTIQVKPLEFYEGEVLKSFAGDDKNTDISQQENALNTGMYFEMAVKPLENAGECSCGVSPVNGVCPPVSC